MLAQLKDEAGAEAGAPFDLPINVTPEQLQLICNAFLKNVSFTVVNIYPVSIV